jgi:hypothetical protein
MELLTQIGRDHPVDLLRVVPGTTGSATYELLLVLVPVEFRGGTVKFCFLGRSDVTILRDGARNLHPTQSAAMSSGRFSNLVMKLRAGDVIKVGLGLIDLKLLSADCDVIKAGLGLIDLTLLSVDHGRATIKATMLVDHLLLKTVPLEGSQELNVRGMIDRLNRGEDYRCDAS